MEKKVLRINISRQSGGYNFGLSPLTRRDIEARFKNAKPVVGHIYISARGDWDFGQMHNLLGTHVLPLITGLETEDLRFLADEAVFVNTMTDKIEYKLPISHVEETEPVLG